MRTLVALAYIIVMLVTKTAWSADEIIQKEASEHILAEHVLDTSNHDNSRRIYLRQANNNSSPAELLCEYERSAVLLFSPDENTIVLNDHAGSNFSNIRLFRKKEGLKFEEDKKIDISGKAWAFIYNTHHSKQGVDLFHIYSNAVAWSADSAFLLINLGGHTDIDNYVSESYCIVSVLTGKISSDLNVFNRASVHYKGKVTK